MSICEIIFATKKYPDLKSEIKDSYLLLEQYDNKLKAIKNLYKDDEKNIHPKLKDLAELLTFLETQDSAFKDYFIVPKAHNKKRETALNKINQAVISNNQNRLDILKKLELELSEYGITVAKFYKLYSDLKETKKELIINRNILENSTNNYKDLFRSLYRI